jgi:hypothetical protein
MWVMLRLLGRYVFTALIRCEKKHQHESLFVAADPSMRFVALHLVGMTIGKRLPSFFGVITNELLV